MTRRLREIGWAEVRTEGPPAYVSYGLVTGQAAVAWIAGG
jgi:hypothetical protein